MDATYSPEDNKLRLYPDSRLDEETYRRVKNAGYRWAPRQELFVCPAWSPQAAKLAEELSGEIGDEDTSLAERAEQRAQRFEDYSGSRRRDAEQAREAVSKIADKIPLGQPILVGHHSEKRARRDAKKIDDGMRRAVKMWETSQYWEQRARGVLASADYKARPAVRARRIKKLEAERRRLVRTYEPNPKAGEIMQPRSDFNCRHCDGYHPHSEAEDGHKHEYKPEGEPERHVWCGASRGGSWVPKADLEARERWARPWIEHIDLRLTYERALLGEQGAADLLQKPKRPKAPPLLNYRAETLSTISKYNGEETTYPQHEATKAELRKIHSDYKGTRLSVDKSHRFRIASGHYFGSNGHTWVAVFLTDSKVHERPEPAEKEEVKP